MTTIDAIQPSQSVFERVVARDVARTDLHHGRLVHLMWRAPQQGERLVQIYLNGRLADYTRSFTQREAWLVVDHARDVQIECIAVNPRSVLQDHGHLLQGVSPATSPAACLVILRDASFPADALVHVQADQGRIIDRLPLFLPGDVRGGFGAVFGEGSFGVDASTGPGLGRGALGVGPLGVDGESLHWRDDTLDPGLRRLEIQLTSSSGDLVAEPLIEEVHIDRLPDPPMNVRLNSESLLTWS